MSGENKIAVIVDLDGTLFSVDKRKELCEQEANGNKKKFWACFQSPKYMDYDTLNEQVAQFVRDVYEKGALVVIGTGRSELTQKEATINQLKRYNIPFHDIYMRPPNDFSKDYELKSRIVNIIQEKYKPKEIVIIDDSEEVLKRLPGRSYPPNNLPKLF